MSLAERLKRHEGYETFPYPDPVKGYDAITIGVGHNLSANGLPDFIIDQLLDYDIGVARNELDRIHPEWRSYSPNRKDALTELMFIMGAPTLLSFKRMWGYIKTGDWAEAAVELLDSRFAEQVGQRAHTIADLLEDG